jgi:hypothetical protein
MKTKAFLVLVALLLGSISTTFAQTAEQNTSTGKVEVYYFHNERRCATCVAVEDESVKALNELYPEKMKSGEITFLSVNIEDDATKPLTDKFEIAGQTLLIVKGTKQENLTNTAFMYATTKPEKLKKAIGEAVEKL